MTKKNIRTAKRWAFPIVAAAFAILQITKGEILLALWVSMAGVFHWAATVSEERCEDLEDEVEKLAQANRDNAKTFDEIITANHDLAEALRQKDAETSQLLNEIETLKNKLRS